MKKFSLIKYVSDINEVIKNLLITDKKGDKLSINHGCDGFIELVKKVGKDDIPALVEIKLLLLLTVEVLVLLLIFKMI